MLGGKFHVEARSTSAEYKILCASSAALNAARIRGRSSRRIPLWRLPRQYELAVIGDPQSVDPIVMMNLDFTPTAKQILGTNDGRRFGIRLGS